MFFQSSRGILFALCDGIIFLCSVCLRDKHRTQFLASVNGVEITLKQVDDSVAARIYPLQQQLYAIRKAALENLSDLEASRTRGRCSRSFDRRAARQLTLGEINVTRAQVEDAYRQNASFFASMSPDEARERLRLDLENQARMKHYRTGPRSSAKEVERQTELSAAGVCDGVGRRSFARRKGSTKPLVTIVEFSDFECPFCSSGANDAEAGHRELRQRGAVRVQALAVGRPSKLFAGGACGLLRRRAGSVLAVS